MKDKILKDYIDLALENPEIASIEVSDWKPFLSGQEKPVFKLVKRDPSCIPWQKCPVCDGRGEIWKEAVDSTCMMNGFIICDVCNGTKVIPMKIQ